MTPTRAALLCLGGLALVAAGCRTEATVDLSSSQRSAEATAAPDIGSTGQDDTDATVDLEPDPTPASAPTDTPQTPEPAETPDVAPDGDVNVDTLSALLFGPRGFDADLTEAELDCASERLSQDTGLLQRSATVPDFEDLPLNDQTALILMAFDCAPDAVAEEFSRSFDQTDTGIDIPDSVGQCLVDRLGDDNPDRRSVIEGFLALGNDQPVPLEAQTPVVDTMVSCFPGSLFADAIAQSALEDPGMAEALDADCVVNSLDGESLRPFWQLLVQNPGVDLDFDTVDPQAVAPMLNAIFGCISFGQVIATQAALDGVTLSDGTIACIDENIIGLDLAAMIETGEGANELTAALFACLTPEELQAIGG